MLLEDQERKMRQMGLGRKKSWLVFFLAAVFFAPAGVWCETGSRVMRTSEKTVATDAEAQKEVEAWVAEEAALLEEIEKAQEDLKRVNWQRQMALASRESLENKIAELGQRAEEMKIIREKLLWVLDLTLKRLEDFIKADMPFDKDLRNRHLLLTREAFLDYDTSTLQKARIVFDAVARETDFGHTVQVKDHEIRVGGEPVRVKLLRVGRVGLWALTTDARKAFVYSREQKKWLALAPTDTRPVEEAVEMAEGVRLIELSRLPMGPVVQKQASGGHGVETR